jgi:hypothetical protein
MPFGLAAGVGRQLTLYCHGCGRQFPHKHGTGLYCRAGCEGETKTRQAVEEEKLKTAGFEQDVNSPHNFTKDSVAVSIEQVLRSSHENVVAIHAEAVRSIRANQAGR